jgi:hypothetical protein
MKLIEVTHSDRQMDLEVHGVSLPEDVIKAFVELGDNQRGEPEQAMVRLQRVYGGGVLSYVVEHGGDLTHRMSHMASWPNSNAGQDYIVNKCQKTLNTLTHRYGFAREMQDNIKSNAEYYNIPVNELTIRIDKALKEYKEAHQKLIVYNHMQFLAKTVPICLGEKDWNGAIEALRTLLAYANQSTEKWVVDAYEYKRDSTGKIRSYP